MENKKRIIAICGWSGSGKTKAKNYITRRLRCEKIEISDIIDKLSDKGGVDLIGNPIVFAKLIEKISKTKGSTIVVGGIREKYLLEGLEFVGYDVISVSIECKEDKRVKRLLARGLINREIISKTKREERIGTLQAIDECRFSINNSSDDVNLFNVGLDLFLIEVRKKK